MVVDAILGWFLDAISWLVDAAPSGHLGLPDVTGLGYLAGLDAFLPIHEVFGAVIAVIALTPAFLLTTLISWVLIGIVRGGATRA